MSYKVEVRAVGESSYNSSGVRLATSKEAQSYGHDLFCRWFGADDYRIAESEDAVNYRWTDHGLEKVKERKFTLKKFYQRAMELMQTEVEEFHHEQDETDEQVVFKNGFSIQYSPYQSDAPYILWEERGDAFHIRTTGKQAHILSYIEKEVKK